MNKWGRNAAGLSLVSIFAISLFNASWTATAPTGAPKLIAALPADIMRGSDGCPDMIPIGSYSGQDMGGAAVNDGLDTQMLMMAAGNDADGVAVQSEMVGGVPVLKQFFTDTCAADKNRPRAAVNDALAMVTKPERYVAVNNAAHAQALSLALTQASDPTEGDAAPGATIYYAAKDSALAPLKGRPQFSISQAQSCTSDYKLNGWYGAIPASCKGGTVLLTLDQLGFTLWGWPNRFLSRMADAKVKVMIAQEVKDGRIVGLTALDQYNDIASSYNGYIWIDKIEEMGPALKR